MSINRKKLLYLSFFLICNYIFSNTSEVTTSFFVKEISCSKATQNIRKYEVIYKNPDYIKQIIQFPDLNKGETYSYIKTKKIVFLPIFNESYEENISENDLLILKIFNKIITSHDKIDSSIVFDDFTVKVIKEIKVSDKYYPNIIEIFFKNKKMFKLIIDRYETS